MTNQYLIENYFQNISNINYDLITEGILDKIKDKLIGKFKSKLKIYSKLFKIIPNKEEKIKTRSGVYSNGELARKLLNPQTSADALIDLGFSQSYINKNKDLAQRILNNDIKAKDGLNLMLNEFKIELKKGKLKFIGKVSAVFGLLIILMLFQLVIMAACSSIFSPVTAAFLTLVILGPLTEEFYKLITVKMNMSTTGLIMFNAVEFTGYVLGMVLGPKKYSVILAVFIRLIPATMHTLNTLRFKIADLQDKVHGTKSYTINAFLLNFVYHAILNLGAFYGKTVPFVFSMLQNMLTLNPKKLYGDFNPSRQPTPQPA